jgi:plastocyanin
MPKLLLAAAILLAVSLSACGGDSESRAVTVDVADFKFKPAAVTVEAGGTITFANGDKAPHTAQTNLNPKAAEFDTGRLAKGEKKVVKLTHPGRFSYFCAYHRFMKGTVKVVE